MNLFESNIDLIIFTFSCIILLIYLIKLLQSGGRNSDDDGGNDGGQLNPANDPVLDLPPGVTLPKDVAEPEAV